MVHNGPFQYYIIFFILSSGLLLLMYEFVSIQVMFKLLYILQVNSITFVREILVITMCFPIKILLND